MATPKTYHRQLKPNERGIYRVAVGKIADRIGGSTARFDLGREPREAARRLALLQALYEQTHSHGYWTPAYLDVARAIAKGQEVRFAYHGGEDATGYARLVSSTATHTPVITQLSPPDPEQMQTSLQAVQAYVDRKVKETLDALRKELEPQLKMVNGEIPSQVEVTTTQEAFEAYRDDRVKNYVGTFQGATKRKGDIDHLIEQVPDLPLYRFRLDQIREVITYYRNRPITKHGKQCSSQWAKNQLGELKRALKWIGHNYSWTCPDLDALQFGVKCTHNDNIKNGIVDKHWTPDELKEIYKTAQPVTKLIIALGLNLGAGPAELGRLRVEQFYFDCQHPKVSLMGWSEVGSYVSYIRPKSGAQAECYLWPWVSELVQEHIRTLATPYIFSEGKEPLYRDNELYKELGLPLPNTIKPEARFVRRFTNSCELALKQGRIERTHSIGKLRKTLPNYLSSNYSEELASILLAHVPGDNHLLNYTNRGYARLFKALKESETYWKLQ